MWRSRRFELPSAAKRTWPPRWLWIQALTEKRPPKREASVARGRFELPTSGLWILRSNQLSYLAIYNLRTLWGWIPVRRGGYESCAPRNSSGQANQLSNLAIYNLYTLWGWISVRSGGYESCAHRNSSGQANQLSYLAKFLFLFLGMFGNIGYLPKHLFSFLFTQSI